MPSKNTGASRGYSPFSLEVKVVLTFLDCYKIISLNIIGEKLPMVCEYHHLHLATHFINILYIIELFMTFHNDVFKKIVFIRFI